jgi:hypothetical protein
VAEIRIDGLDQRARRSKRIQDLVKGGQSLLVGQQSRRHACSLPTAAEQQRRAVSRLELRQQVRALAALREGQRDQPVTGQAAGVQGDQRHGQRGHEQTQARHHQVGRVVGGVVAAATRHGQQGPRGRIAQAARQSLQGVGVGLQKRLGHGRGLEGLGAHS